MGLTCRWCVGDAHVCVSRDAANLCRSESKYAECAEAEIARLNKIRDEQVEQIKLLQADALLHSMWRTEAEQTIDSRNAEIKRLTEELGGIDQIGGDGNILPACADK